MKSGKDGRGRNRTEGGVNRGGERRVKRKVTERGVKTDLFGRADIWGIGGKG